MSETIKVTCTGATTLPLEAITDFQGALKYLPPDSKQRLIQSIRRHGIAFPVFVWKSPDGQFYNIDGHQRVYILREMKQKGFEIPPLPVAFIQAEDESHAREKLLIATSMYGRFNQEEIGRFVSGINNKEIHKIVDLSGIDIEKVLSIFNAKCSPEIVPNMLDKPTKSRKGDLWTLGNNQHRLFCGDATNIDDVNTLLAGSIPSIMVSDPPYGVGLGDNAGLWRASVDKSSTHKTGGFTGDDRADWFDAIKLFPGHIIYMWHASAFASVVQQSLQDAGFETRSQIIWAKTHWVLSRGNYHYQTEPCWYCIRQGKTAGWIGGRSQSTLWTIPNSNPFSPGRSESDVLSNVNTMHCTQKPTECMERPLRNHENDGGVYDPFVGSGTTIIAAERQGLKSFTMDINPIWADTSVQRWIDYTGLDAVRQDGAKWSELQVSE